ncbi:mechanosensitive ion channel family protein [Algiphilus sp. NNCM1]|uniref:mechanosensitive ion channel family protein n=1 Tax=Algiphilus sp. TaxID=1872431 RepID=UPI001CA74CFF|nr:mechanosensitive ion channel family protein [Algiphilus sp.]MBY8964640.1 mechanosensitive ion channel family protein [Algiphilus acroporae]MCI5063940.1 mechanosensitive ion channel family protein [Algiphilus sp.]MCI5102974.1 mechanosensitive ion channel family protein [Algiphilus sp.]
MVINEWLASPVYGNPLLDWLIALAIALSINAVVAAIKWLVDARLRVLAERTHTPVDDSLVAAVLRSNQLLVLVISLAIGAHYLELPATLMAVLRGAAIIAGFTQLGLYLNALIEFWAARSEARARESDMAAATTLRAIKFVAKGIMWTMLLLLALDNLGVNVTALVAGLGVGGIAVALAVQNILGDLFASLSIVVDKPFVLGDFIMIDSYMGTVEHIGLKTTRLRSLGGEQLVFSNSDLLKARLQNFQRLQERRVILRLGIVYHTETAMIERVPELIREAISAQEGLRFERAHFAQFGPSSLNFEAVYWVLDPNYVRFMDLQHAVNMGIVERFRAHGIEFAFPTQTVHLGSMPAVSGDAFGGVQSRSG